MNVDAIEGEVAAGADSQVPFYFQSNEHALFAWLHQSRRAPSCEWGVVLCKPFGYEALCGHRSLRAFASAAAERGIPTLRFDYQGTGDSADIDPHADQIEVWTRDIIHAAAELRRRTGVARICLMGFRLGALLAVRAARQCEASALVLIAPVLSGRKYLREVRTAQLAAEAAGAVTKSRAPATAMGYANRSMEVSGYPLSPASIASLSAAEIKAASLSDVSDVLLIDRSDLPVARRLSQALREQGVATEHHELEGFVQMMLTAPQFATPPRVMLQVTADWLELLRAKHLSTGPDNWMTAPEPGREDSAAPRLFIRGGDGSSGIMVTERPVFLAADGTLFGIVTEPPDSERRRRAVILLNTGADCHIGASRMYVSLARRWARKGYWVLRMDFPGLGDSAALAGRSENDVFPPDALKYIAIAMDHFVSHDIHDIAVAGLCSGAYHALRAAAAGMPLTKVLMVNAANYFWDESMSLKDLQLVEVVRNPSVYREKIFVSTAWRRFLTGRVDIWRIVRIYFRRPVLALQSVLRETSRAFGIRLRHDLGRELEEITSRGVRLVFVFARGEPGIELLRIEAGSMVRRLGDRCRLRIIDSADHTFSRGGPREVLEFVLSEELFARREGEVTYAQAMTRLA